MTCDFQQCGILTSVDSDEPVQPPSKLTNSKRCSDSSLTVIEYSSDSKDSDQTACLRRLIGGFAGRTYNVPHCWKSLVAAHTTVATAGRSSRKLWHRGIPNVLSRIYVHQFILLP